MPASVGIATREKAEALTGCVIGAIPPFSFNEQLLVLADPLIAENEEVVFNAGRLDRSIFMRSADYIRVARPRLVAIAIAGMNILLLKLVLTPSLIGAASLAGRKWGHSISGWFVAMPLTTGPITLFLALTQGTSFAARTAAGTLAGAFSLVAFVIAYARLARHWAWLPTLAASTLAFALITAALQQTTFPLVPLWAGVVLVLALAIQLLPRDFDSGPTPDEGLPGRWDIPLRMAIATGFVLLITGVAPALGPHLTGLLIPFPIFTATVAAFAHHQHGPAAAISVFRGLLMGLFSYASFMFTLALLLETAGIAVAFAVAIVVVLVLQAGSLWLLQRRID